MATQQADSHPRYFVAKCGGIDSLRRCVASRTWASRERVTPPQPHETLTAALSQGPVVLLFSVNNCHGWHGYCHMMSPPKRSVTGTALVTEELVGCQQQHLAVGQGEELTAEVRQRALVTEELVGCQRQNLGVGQGEELTAEVRRGRDSECDVTTALICANMEKTAGEKADDPALFDSSTLYACSDFAKKTASMRALEHASSDSTSHMRSPVSSAVPLTTSEKIDSTTQILSPNSYPSDKILANNPNPSCDSDPLDTCTWHYFEVKWQTEFISSFGEMCLPSSKTTHLLIPGGSPLNKARNWQEISSGVGAEVCALIDEMYLSLVEKRRKLDEAKLAAKPLPFIRMEGDVQEDSQRYWRCIVEKVERELGCVHLACPFGSQRYNVQQPESDIDAFIVYQAHTKDLLGFSPPKMTIKNSERETCDYTVLELKRYCELLLAYDARCIETLFLHDSTVIQASAEWRQLQKLRQQFLTRKCLDKYLGDALGSNGVQKLHRSLENSTVSGDQAPPPRIAKLIYIIVRLLQNALDIAKGGPLNVFRPVGSTERNTLLKIRKANVTLDEIKAVIQRLQEEIDQGKDSVIQEVPSSKSNIESWLLMLRFQDIQMHPPSEENGCSS